MKYAEIGLPSQDNAKKVATFMPFFLGSSCRATISLKISSKKLSFKLDKSVNILSFLISPGLKQESIFFTAFKIPFINLGVSSFTALLMNWTLGNKLPEFAPMPNLQTIKSSLEILLFTDISLLLISQR